MIAGGVRETVAPACPSCGPGTVTVRIASVESLGLAQPSSSASAPPAPTGLTPLSPLPCTLKAPSPTRPLLRRERGGDVPAASPLRREKGARFAWACSVAGMLVGAGACAAILVANAAHAASGVAPVLAPAPLNVALVAVAFGLAAIVAEWLPSLVGAAPRRVGSRAAAVVALVPVPVIARCAACGSVFGDSGVRAARAAGAAGEWSPSVN